ncbi:MAG: hydrogenase [Patescibacteria group bacterium]|nr:MAG: hydrogenase [Patescibacteria group bacterium]
MCLAIPGKVIKINGMKVTVKYPHDSREVLDGGISVKVGDYVLVQMGIIIRRIGSKEAKSATSAWK